MLKWFDAQMTSHYSAFMYIVCFIMPIAADRMWLHKLHKQKMVYNGPYITLQTISTAVIYLFLFQIAYVFVYIFGFHV